MTSVRNDTETTATSVCAQCGTRLTLGRRRHDRADACRPNPLETTPGSTRPTRPAKIDYGLRTPADASPATSAPNAARTATPGADGWDRAAHVHIAYRHRRRRGPGQRQPVQHQLARPQTQTRAANRSPGEASTTTNSGAACLSPAAPTGHVQPGPQAVPCSWQSGGPFTLASDRVPVAPPQPEERARPAAKQALRMHTPAARTPRCWPPRCWPPAREQRWEPVEVGSAPCSPPEVAGREKCCCRSSSNSTVEATNSVTALRGTHSAVSGPPPGSRRRRRAVAGSLDEDDTPAGNTAPDAGPGRTTNAGRAGGAAGSAASAGSPA